MNELCGATRLHVPPCKNTKLEPNMKKAKYIILGIISVVLLVASVSIFLHLKRNVEVPTEATSLSQRLLWRRVSQLELVRVTNGFNENNLLGSGGFGSVYKGALSDGTYVAVKVFSLKLEGAFKSFDRECEMLSNIQRMNIIIDAAFALEYLHHGYSLPILHCDIKPNNILLDDDVVAHVGDFGIAKLLGGGDFTTESMTLATVGYMAPDLSSNYLIGHLSQDIGNLKVVIEVDLSTNNLSGILPSTIGGLRGLANLSLANNNLEGPIPSSFDGLLSLQLLDLSRNNLSGVIPKSLEALSLLKYMDLSFNMLQGEIPTGVPFQNFSAQSFVSNKALCGVARLHVPPCKNGTVEPNWRKAKYIIPGIISVILFVASASIFVLRRKRNVEVAGEATSLPQLLWRRISHSELRRATNGFNENNLLESRGFGSVYKRTLSDGIDVAVKVFSLQLEGAFKSFDRECEMLSNIRHRNLIKIISCCSELDFKALVLNYMPNGSLDKWLYSQDYSLNILQRLNIMIDAASALEYLHHGYSIPIVHCDMKPSNILLDDEMVAHVADFGIAKLLGGGDSITQTMTLATIGYMAPEYGLEGMVSTRGMCTVSEL
ncbi:hypothetical protein L3X38_021476 [Prunus dulcis]|uniref:non-specific serine/threonine protein kinase n=1 Tax=Prunus dulcis TaxID=3755 RepID=A0AAD4VU57_PRUDU|nr:hypothetical protein L3X38_021476 [Prunus dulcis]